MDGLRARVGAMLTVADPDRQTWPVQPDVQCGEMASRRGMPVQAWREPTSARFRRFNLRRAAREAGLQIDGAVGQGEDGFGRV